MPSVPVARRALACLSWSSKQPGRFSTAPARSYIGRDGLGLSLVAARAIRPFGTVRAEGPGGSGTAVCPANFIDRNCPPFTLK